MTGTSNVGGDSVETKIVVKGANFCPDDNAACKNQDHFDIAAPGFDFVGGTKSSIYGSISNDCTITEPGEYALHNPQTCSNWMIEYDDPAYNCDCNAFYDQTLVDGCNNFLSLGWNNPNVKYEQLASCPSQLSTDAPCWANHGQTWPTESTGFCAAPPLDGSVYVKAASLLSLAMIGAT